MPGEGDGPERTPMRKIAVFCGSSSGKSPKFAEAAAALGKEMTRRGQGLVYGGGNIGLMGKVAHTVKDGGCSVLGVIPTELEPEEVSGQTVGDVRVVGGMHERKAVMAQESDGFIALPGGFGTMEELLEVLTWQQLGYHAKPVGLLNVEGYYDPLLTFLDNAVELGFLSKQSRASLLVSTDPADLIDQLEAYRAPPSVIQLAKEGKFDLLTQG
ncbi:unnamed protein product [Pedinophyceae sp. YPF-701]|nr:unnamed protein product [Pedinophyceae sp. YPF-701]